MLKQLFRSYPVFCAILVMFLTLLPVMCIRDVTPSNELRYLSIADEAIEQGHVFAFTNQGEDYADKPPFYFWLLMLSKIIFGKHQIFALSLFSFIPAAVILLVMDRWCAGALAENGLPFSPSERFAAAIMTGTGALFLGMSIFLRMDMLMCMFIVLALYEFYMLYKDIGNYRLHSYLYPLFTFMALFTKGPVGLIVPLLCPFVFLVLNGKIKDASKYFGWKTWGILLLLSAIWFAGVYFEAGTAYLDNLLFHQTVDRAVDAFHHKEPFWYYLIVFWYVVAPFSLLGASSLAGSLSVCGRKSDAERLFMVIFFSTLITLSAFSSKLAIYLAPVFPFISGVFFLHLKSARWNAWYSAMLSIPVTILLFAGLAMMFLPLFAPVLAETGQFVTSPWVSVSGILLAFCCLSSLFMLFIRKSWSKAISSAGLSLLFAVLGASPLLPEINDYVGYGNLCREAMILKESSQSDGYVTLRVNRPENMDVYLGEDIRSFANDADSLVSSGVSNVILMVKTSAVTETVAEYCGGSTPNAIVGDYSLYVIERPGNDKRHYSN